MIVKAGNEAVVGEACKAYRNRERRPLGKSLKIFCLYIVII
jgi:hypothetical protein